MSSPLKIFISYVRQDSAVADALLQTLVMCFGNKVEVFTDAVVLQTGVELRDTLRQQVTHADMLMIVSAGSVPLSHEWAGFELGVFEATHRPESRSKGDHPLWGKVVTFCRSNAIPSAMGTRLYVPLDVYWVGKLRKNDATLKLLAQMYEAIHGESVNSDP